MTNRFRAALTIAVPLLLAGAMVLGVDAAGKPSSDVPVITTIADFGGGFPLRVQSDLKGSYSQSSQVTSLIVGTTGDWTLTTYYSANGKGGNPFTPSNRSVFFDLSEPVSVGNPAPPLTVGYQQSHLMAKCSKVGFRFLQIPLGTSVGCPGVFRFQAPNGLWYRLGFQPENYPEVQHMSVTCTAADSIGCKAWSIRPGGTTLTGTDPNPKSVAKLLQIDPGTSEAVADLGDYYVSFSIAVTR